MCDGGFDERGRRVGIVFQKFRWRDAVVGKIKPAVKAEIIAFPRAQNFRDRGLGNFQARPPVVFDDSLCRVNAAEMQFVRGGFQLAHFARREFVARGLVPVRAVFMRVKREADALNAFAPIGTGLAGVALHHE